MGTDFSLYGRASLGLVALRRVLRAMENVRDNSETALVFGGDLVGGVYYYDIEREFGFH